jgi:Fe-S oxidoreductase
MDSLSKSITQTRVWQCLDCGKCSALCPITKWEAGSYASPRLLVDLASGGREEELLQAPLLWACLTCKRCSELCPADVDFPEFIRQLRALAREDGLSGTCTHSAIFQTVGKIMVDPDLQQDRLRWLDDDCLVSEDSDVVFFVGCLPYFAPVFEKWGVDVLDTARSAIKILNLMGIQPQVLADERCCGHDQRWQGDLETFQRLAERNMDLFSKRGTKLVVTACPECARTLKFDYKAFNGHNFSVRHITELIAESEGFKALFDHPNPGAPHNPLRVTYHDPCRLGRHLGIYDAPRKIIAALGFDLSEMERSRKRSQCCGTSCWTACGQANKNIQVERLEEARAAGAELLITACVKCQIHFTCAQIDPVLGNEIELKVQDLVSMIADYLPSTVKGMVRDE